MKKKIMVGITGASGVYLGITALKILRDLQIETHCILSKPAKMTIVAETEYAVSQVESMADFTYNNANVGAICASGTFAVDGMIIVPCSMKTLGDIANGMGGSLLSRTADVMLKERRKLVVMPREMPFTLAHIRNMETITLMGGIICPPAPAFYLHPQSIQDIVHQIVARSLTYLDIADIDLKRWSGFVEKKS